MEFLGGMVHVYYEECVKISGIRKKILHPIIDKKRRFFLYQSSFNNNTKFILKLYYYLSAKDWNLKFKNI